MLTSEDALNMLQRCIYRSGNSAALQKCDPLSDDLIFKIDEFYRFAQVYKMHCAGWEAMCYEKIRAGDAFGAESAKFILQHILCMEKFVSTVSVMISKMQNFYTQLFNCQKFQHQGVQTSFAEFERQVQQAETEFRMMFSDPASESDESEMSEEDEEGRAELPEYRAITAPMSHSLSELSFEEQLDRMNTQLRASASYVEAFNNTLADFKDKAKRMKKRLQPAIDQYDCLDGLYSMLTRVMKQSHHRCSKAVMVHDEIQIAFEKCFAVLARNKSLSDTTTRVNVGVALMEKVNESPLQMMSIELHISDMLNMLHEKEKAFRTKYGKPVGYGKELKDFYFSPFVSGDTHYSGLENILKLYFAPQDTRSTQTTFQYQGRACLPLATSYGMNGTEEVHEQRLLVCAPTGTGKSTIMQIMLAAYRGISRGAKGSRGGA